MLTAAVIAKIPQQWQAAQPQENWFWDHRIQESLQFCKASTQHHAKSFYFCSHTLQPSQRWAAYAVYAFCRYIDDWIDEQNPPPSNSLDILQAELIAINQGKSTLPLAPALQKVNQEFNIPDSFYQDLILGCCLDIQALRLETYPDLEMYCYHVASVVGLIMSKIFGLTTAQGALYATGMGVAMQLTNILRDVAEDHHKGRRYLPADELQQFDIDPDNILSSRNTPQWKAFMQFQIKRARQFYQYAESGIPLLSPYTARLTTQAMGRVYGGILKEIENKQYDIFHQRVRVPTHKKIALLFSCFL